MTMKIESTVITFITTFSNKLTNFLPAPPSIRRRKIEMPPVDKNDESLTKKIFQTNSISIHQAPMLLKYER